MATNKVLVHPERKEIIRRLTEGESVKSVERWLKSKHPKSKRLQVSYMTLQKFRKEYLKLEGKVLDDIKQAKAERDETTRSMETQMIIANAPSYIEKINEIADSELDVTRKLLELEKILSSRLEFYYNEIANGGTIKEDKIFLDYIDRYKGVLQDWKKYVEGVADQKIEHNVSIQVVNDQATILKEVIFETLREINQAELIPVFVSKLSTKMGQLEHGSEKYNMYKDVIDV